MKDLVAIPLTILVAAAAAYAGRLAVPGGADEDAARAAEPETLALARSGIQELRAENARLAGVLAARSNELVAAGAPVDEDELDDAEIGAALERWRAAHPEEARIAAEPRRPSIGSGELDLATVPMIELVQALGNAGLTNLERQELFQRLREAGRIDEYVAEMEKLAAADPDNADLQVALGNAYLQKLFGMGGASSEVGMLAMKSDACFDRALEIDDHNWGARFTKAVSLSNWPAFLGRGSEAIEHFEELLDQQAEVPPRPEFAMTYLFLGNMYQANGNPEKALATWKEGLDLFPGVDDLEHAIELAEGD